MPRVRIGKNMIRAVAFVAAHPKCAKTDVARALHGLPAAGPVDQSGGYATVNRAIAVGLLTAELSITRGPKLYLLRVTPLGHQLLKGTTS